jgi:HTH-type transcriptional regulator / antitoxin HigA
MAVMAQERPFRPTYAVAPGQTIADLLEEHDMTQSQLARRLGVTLKHVNQIVNGGASISAELALGLEKVFRVPADFWLNREALYRADVARQTEAKELQPHVEWAKRFPLRELKKRGYLPSDATGVELVGALLRFLGIAAPRQWHDPVVAYRKSQRYKSDSFALATWLRAGEVEASEIETEPYDAERFAAALEAVRPLTRLEPQEWHPLLVDLCRAAGVAVVVVDTFEGARANGATRWLTPNKALIQLSLRYRWEDVFWFTFFHEAAHVVLHRKKEIFVEGLPREDLEPNSGWQKLEDEANRFAARVLIPEKYEERLQDISLSDVQALADELQVAPAIVIGRLQHDGVIPFSEGNQRKRRFVFVE